VFVQIQNVPKSLALGLRPRPGPTWKLTALLQTPTWIRERRRKRAALKREEGDGIGGERG